MKEENEQNLKVQQRREELFRSMSAAEKLDAATKLYFSALSLKEARLQRTNPDWTEEKVQKKAREWMLYART